MRRVRLREAESSGSDTQQIKRRGLEPWPPLPSRAGPLLRPHADGPCLTQPPVSVRDPLRNAGHPTRSGVLRCPETPHCVGHGVGAWRGLAPAGHSAVLAPGAHAAGETPRDCIGLSRVSDTNGVPRESQGSLPRALARSRVGPQGHGLFRRQRLVNVALSAPALEVLPVLQVSSWWRAPWLLHLSHQAFRPVSRWRELALGDSQLPGHSPTLPHVSTGSPVGTGEGDIGLALLPLTAAKSVLSGVRSLENPVFALGQPRNLLSPHFWS